MKTKINTVTKKLREMNSEETMFGIKQAAKYLYVSDDTLRLWDKEGKLKPIRTAGGHRRYTKKMLDEFIKNETNPSTYGSLYEHLCSAQYIADELQDDCANDILKIRNIIGERLLKLHEENAKC